MYSKDNDDHVKVEIIKEFTNYQLSKFNIQLMY